MSEERVPDDDWLVRGDAPPADVADHYDVWAASYDTDLEAWSYRAPDAVADVLTRLDPAPGSVVDVGCGTGMVGRALRARGSTARVVGLDISRQSLTVAQLAGAYDDLRAADLRQPLPLGDDAYDALVCCGVMTYLPAVEATWREFARRTSRRARRRHPARGPLGAARVPGGRGPARRRRDLGAGRGPRSRALPPGVGQRAGRPRLLLPHGSGRVSRPGAPGGQDPSGGRRQPSSRAWAMWPPR